MKEDLFFLQSKERIKNAIYISVKQNTFHAELGEVPNKYEQLKITLIIWIEILSKLVTTAVIFKQAT